MSPSDTILRWCVETIEQLRAVRELGCDFVQGYLVSPALDPKALKGWVRKFRRAWPALIAEEKLALWGEEGELPNGNSWHA